MFYQAFSFFAATDSQKIRELWSLPHHCCYIIAQENEKEKNLIMLPTQILTVLSPSPDPYHWRDRIFPQWDPIKQHRKSTSIQPSPTFLSWRLHEPNCMNSGPCLPQDYYICFYFIVVLNGLFCSWPILFSVLSSAGRYWKHLGAPGSLALSCAYKGEEKSRNSAMLTLAMMPSLAVSIQHSCYGLIHQGQRFPAGSQANLPPTYPHPHTLPAKWEKPSHTLPLFHND